MNDPLKELTLDSWQEKLCAIYESGKTPSYSDIEGALLAYVKDKKRLNNLMNSLVMELNSIVIPRLNNESDANVLAALDDFIVRRARVVGKNVVQEGLVH